MPSTSTGARPGSVSRVATRPRPVRRCRRGVRRYSWVSFSQTTVRGPTRGSPPAHGFGPGRVKGVPQPPPERQQVDCLPAGTTLPVDDPPTRTAITLCPLAARWVTSARSVSWSRRMYGGSTGRPGPAITGVRHSHTAVLHYSRLLSVPFWGCGRIYDPLSRAGLPFRKNFSGHARRTASWELGRWHIRRTPLTPGSLYIPDRVGDPRCLAERLVGG